MRSTLSLPLRGFASAFLFILLCFAFAPAAAQQNSVAGHWEGAIKLPGNELKISVDFTAAADGKLSATITIPQQGAKDLPLSDVGFTGGEVTFAIPGVPGDPKFKGKLSDDKQKIEGTFSQGGANLPCNLERKADPAAAAKDALAGFDDVVNDAMKKLDVPGMAIAIVKGKQVIYAKGFGYRDVEKQLPVTADTLFAIGSSTKAFTTFVLGTLVDEGKVEWDKPLRNYIPWFKLYDPAMTEHLSVRDTVTHRSGLPRHDLVWYNNFESTREAFVRKLAYLEPSADLRQKWQYNNLMYLTAGYLTEVLTGQTWEDAVRTRVFNPLGFKRSNFSVADSQKDSDFAQPYARRDGKVEKIPFRPITNIGPAGSINSSVNEMARWVTAHLNGGKYGDKKIAEASTVADMHAAHMVTGATNPEPEITGGEYGMGWFADNYRGRRRVQHGGNIDGFSANVVLFPKDDLGMVVLTNLNGTPLRDLIAQVAADRLLGLKPNDWIGQAVARRAAAEAASKEGEKKKTDARIAGTQASHKLADYAGDYEHPGYGVLKVALNGDRLEAVFNKITTPLEHWHYDTFTGGKAKDGVFENMKYTFQTDAGGFIAAVSAPFEASVSPIVFKKKPDSQLFDPAYLARFAGEYSLMGTPWVVSLKGNALVVNSPGQSQMDLIPNLSGDFAIKQTQVVTLHFVNDESGKPNAIEIRQPGTVLTAKRK
ncbi:MAG TPA: serine hydrolase [Blastocatellia bacterium]|nr:serine hydrolase [Blastocatellia bacterium]HMV85463.1 serine hydrolase [Blastocatellia bacterium]HMZ17280.1 serine hydrolase [Blastocatellia bacterium]HNG33341.1 serine hydrolase [Blastocatellia bacterium]